ncbi:uncharacterized protein CTHT_0016810 [Thermochaetoides thermophila DSM 1495]|uniref:Uncharacterized protein n=1 Tax=Chaetomium thermophilum (strain DSM 1495 / CBS 144.50 / IMI 039719) TaxID=759272 RepID=G0S2D1_CHATD|nr:hypothetical protein CTHT_0016810 [Thermochaetoides thermophila DSM 1495]EGS22164.1 hypothetical protein CTHT_0016810 [Thermochaetoides thermophila DSM 1495]
MLTNRLIQAGPKDTSPNNSITVAPGPVAPAHSDVDSSRSTPAEMDGVEEHGARPSSVSSSTEIAKSNGQTVIVDGRVVDAYDYQFSDLDEITIRQLKEDILAYEYDLDYCKSQLHEDDLTPQEMRTLQLRILDLGHQIRHCKHRIETIQAQARRSVWRPGGYAAFPSSSINYGLNGTSKPGRKPAAGTTAVLPTRPAVIDSAAQPTTISTGKRSSEDDASETSTKRMKSSPSPEPERYLRRGSSQEGVNTALQRLGFWKCRLCSAPKYLLAGNPRSPAAPCKWPLKDISKMITHFTEMHGEHTPAERCAELGAALRQNRGPFEYWLRKTRAQNITDGRVIDECLQELLKGRMPELLRRHSRAAAGMAMS